MYGVSGKKSSAMKSAPPSSEDILCKLCAILSSGFFNALLANATWKKARSMVPLKCSELKKKKAKALVYLLFNHISGKGVNGMAITRKHKHQNEY